MELMNLSHSSKVCLRVVATASLMMSGTALAQDATATAPTTVPAITQIPPAPSLPPKTGLRLADIRVHDPFIVAHEPTQTYYLYTSAPARQTGLDRFGTMVYKSKDLKTWEGPFIVFLIPDGIWADPMHGSWAPEVHEYNGKFYLFTTLHNRDKSLATTAPATPDFATRKTHMRGTIVAVADAPEGPFKLLQDRPHPPENFMTLDGTLFVEDGKPWMVYCHEWVQTVDGTMEAVPLADDLSRSVGEPIHLFKGSDAPWLNATIRPHVGEYHYVTDGPFFYRTKTGRLLMLWSSYRREADGRSLYVETSAYSESGKLAGPWRQLPAFPLGLDSGHGMLFRTFEGELMLICHHPFGKPTTRGKLYEMEDTGDALRVVRKRNDLDGDPEPTPAAAP